MILPRGRLRSTAAVVAVVLMGPAALLLGLAVLTVLEKQPGAGGSPDIYASGLVVAAPPPSLAGSSSRFEDARGAYERRCFGAAGGPPCVNVLFTRRGFLRSGDLHKDRQVNPTPEPFRNPSPELHSNDDHLPCYFLGGWWVGWLVVGSLCVSVCANLLENSHPAPQA